MQNIEVTKQDAEIVQDILEWANDTTFGSLTPTGYNKERSQNFSDAEFVHYMDMVSHVSPELFLKLNASRLIYKKRDYLHKYLEKGGFIAEFNKLHEKQEKEKEYKQLEEQSMVTSIKTSLQAIELAKDSNMLSEKSNSIAKDSNKLSVQSNDIAKASNRKANLSNVIAGIAALIALIALFLSLKK